MCLLMPPRGVCTHACVCTLMPCGDVTQLTQIRWLSASLNARRGWARASRCGSDNPMMPQRTGADRREHQRRERSMLGQRQEQQIGPTFSRWLQIVQHLNRGEASRCLIHFLKEKTSASSPTVCHQAIFDSWKTPSTFFDTNRSIAPALGDC